jgi:hypothetical protein
MAVNEPPAIMEAMHATREYDELTSHQRLTVVTLTVK